MRLLFPFLYHCKLIRLFVLREDNFCMYIREIIHRDKYRKPPTYIIDNRKHFTKPNKQTNKQKTKINNNIRRGFVN